MVDKGGPTLHSFLRRRDKIQSLRIGHERNGRRGRRIRRKIDIER